MTTFEFEAGIVLCGKIRDYLEHRKFAGANIEWREGKGWFSRLWVIKGNPEDVLEVSRCLTAWFKDIEKINSVSVSKNGKEWT